MSAKLDSARLRSLTAQLADARSWPEGLVEALATDLREADEAALARINPLAWAAKRGFDPDTVIALFLHATRVGLVDIHWGLRCCGCGEIVANPDGLGQLEHDFYCDACARSRATTLDESVEVGFTVHPQVRSIRFHDPESLALEDYFFKHRFSANILVRDIERPLIDYLREQKLVLTWLEPGASEVFEFEIDEPGWVVGNPRCMITVEGEPTSERRELTLDYQDRAFLPRPTVAPGPLRLRLRNTSDERVRVFSYFTPIVTYFDYLPHLSGNRVLNDPDFRRCLGTQVVRPGTGIPVKDNTLLFTDLRGSTQMYERIGDAAAFALVSEHFESMARTVTRCGGVVVKTMGDAIMASFTRPEDAVRAALAILEQEARGGEDGGERLSPKLGVHRGPCIVVNQNDMVDYFGQTVNIAARVQGAAGSNELCVTEAVWEKIRDDRQLAAALAGEGGRRRELVELQGVAEPVGVYRVPAPSRG